MKMKLLKIWSVISTVLVILIVLIAIFLMGSRLLGFRVFNVISGSMSPAYNVGDLIYVKSVPPSEIQVGDPITFVLNEDLVVATHRVVRIDAENSHIYTKGDANQTIDSSPVHFNNVIGVPQFRIPMLGYVSDFIQNPPGMYITIGICCVLIFIVFLPDIVKRAKKKSAEREAAALTEGATTEGALPKEEPEKAAADVSETTDSAETVKAEEPQGARTKISEPEDK